MLHTYTCPDWNGWIYYYDDDELRILSYDEYDCKIDIKIVAKTPSFYIRDKLDRVIKKDWITHEVYDGLAKAFEALFPDACVREDAAKIKCHYWGSTEVN